MARILAYTSPARGHLYPLVPILDDLRRRGHTVFVRTLGDAVAMLRERGLHADAIDSCLEALPLEDYRERSPRSALAASVRGLVSRAELDAVDLTAAIESVQPDALIIDVNSWGAAAAAERWGGPWASLVPYPLSLSDPWVPPFGPGWAPARNASGKLRDAALRPVVTGAIARQLLPGVNAARRAQGLAPLSSTDDIHLRPHRLLVLSAEPFEYPRRHAPSSLTMVGPCPWEPEVSVPQWLAGEQRPIVMISTSSEFQGDGRLVATALEALADEPVRVVATVPAGDPSAFTASPNARVERFVPHGPLLERAVVAVTHGGMGATQKALAAGVPVVAVPFGRDQFEVARRVAVAEAGVRLPASRLTVERLRRAVRDARGMTAGAQRVAQGFRAAGGAVAAADAVESMLAA